MGDFKHTDFARIIIPYPKTHAMALTAMLIRGYETNNIDQSNLLSNDQHKNKRFHYDLANPPFGIKWEKDKSEMEREHKEMGYAGRFGPGLPRVSDGSILFLIHLVSKMESPENGGGGVGQLILHTSLLGQVGFQIFQAIGRQ